LTAYANTLLRLIVQRAGEDSNRIFLSEWKTVEWNSLTLDGERHTATFAVDGPDPLCFAALWLAGLSEAEFDMPRGFVADIEVVGRPALRADGRAEVEIAALTLDD
jgi:hypothetical protein